MSCLSKEFMTSIILGMHWWQLGHGGVSRRAWSWCQSRGQRRLDTTACNSILWLPKHCKVSFAKLTQAALCAFVINVKAFKADTSLSWSYCLCYLALDKSIRRHGKKSRSAYYWPILAVFPWYLTNSFSLIVFTHYFELLSNQNPSNPFRYLLDNSANVSAVNNDGELAIDISESDEMEDILQKEIDKQGINCDESRNTEERLMLEDARSWVNGKIFGDVPHNKTGATALHVAAAKGYIKVMGLLIQSGASVNSQVNINKGHLLTFQPWLMINIYFRTTTDGLPSMPPPIGLNAKPVRFYAKTTPTWTSRIMWAKHPLMWPIRMSSGCSKSSRKSKQHCKKTVQISDTYLIVHLCRLDSRQVENEGKIFSDFERWILICKASASSSVINKVRRIHRRLLRVLLLLLQHQLLPSLQVQLFTIMAMAKLTMLKSKRECWWILNS